MRWWPGPKKSEKKAMVLGLTPELGSFLQFGSTTAATASGALRLYEQSTAVAVPINAISEAFSVVDLALLEGQEMTTESPVLDFLRNPSPYFTGELLLETMAKNYLATGESLVVALGRVNRPPLEVQPLNSDVLTAVEGPGGLPSSLMVTGNTLNGSYLPIRRDGRVRYLDGALRELKMIRNFSTRNNALLRGQSPLVAAAKQVRSHVLGVEHNVSLLERGGRVSLVFHFEEDLDDDQFEEVKQRVRAQYGGSSKAGSIGVTSGGKMRVQEAGVTNKDMDWSSLQSMAEKSVALVLRVPLPLVTEQRQTLNNYKEAKLALYDDAVIPLSRRILGGLGDFLLPRFGLDPKRAQLIVNPESVTALVSRMMEEISKRSKIGVETKNEIRALIGREPVEGGDTLYQAGTLVPVGTDLFTEDNDPDVLEEPVN